ncbi:MAG: DUF2236 domain-containing protein [Burkholderiaceae bacterium]|nr:DUF2236 domain-containing protein [Microbacteriaceae bacterium]
MRLADVGAEAALIAGGGRAILLQLANPAIGHAVARHSDFVRHPLRRLQHTLTYVYALVYGTPAQVATVREMVNRTHERVRSEPGEMPAYDATDAGLQLWVAATLYDTAVTLRHRLVGPLPDADLDAIYADYAVVGTALQVPDGAWPRDRTAFAEYWEAQLAVLSVDETVRATGHDLLHPHTGPLWMRAAMPLARVVTAGLLPPALREAYGLAWSPARERRFALALDTIAALNRVLPRRAREWPKNYLLRELG